MVRCDRGCVGGRLDGASRLAVVIEQMFVEQVFGYRCSSHLVKGCDERHIDKCLTVW